MKILLITFILFFAVSFTAQNVGINQNTPTNSLHISPILNGDNPIRIDGLQSYTIGDTSLLILNPANGVVKYIATNDFINIINNSGNVGTDNQNIDSITLAGNNLTIYIENGTSAVVDLSSLQDADSDPTNEIELPSTAVTNQVLTWDGTNWVAQNAGAGADNWGSQVVQVSGTNISGNGTTANPLAVTDNDSDPTNEIELPTGGTNGQLLSTNGSGTYTWVSDNSGTDNQTLNLSGNTLSISNGNNVTLTDNVNDADFVIGNEYNTGASLAGTTLSVTDGGGSQTVNLSSLVDHDWYEVGGTSAPNNINDNIYTQGKVGIGTANPSEQLTIGINSLVLHNGGNKALGFNNSWTSSTDWLRSTAGSYQGVLLFKPASGDITLASSNLATGWNANNTTNGLFIEGATNRIGLGTISPSEKLEVQGSVKIVDGTQGAGKVLTSDANGKASWQNLLPTGAVIPFNLATCPTGWAPADGTGGMPDLRGEFVRGLDNGRGVDAGRVLGSSQIESLKSHNHSVNPPATNSNTSGNHNHSVDPPNTNTTSNGSHTHSIDPPNSGTSTNGNHSHRMKTSTGAAGSEMSIHDGSTHWAQCQPNAQPWTNSPEARTFAEGNHSHSINISPFNSAVNGNHNHSLNITPFNSSTTGNHAHSTDIPQFNSGTSGASETKPRNVALLYCVKQ